MTVAGESDVGRLVDHLFRHTAGRMVARLARRFGPEALDLVEEAVQDALLRSLETWPYHGIPENPPAWLYQVARNRALDLLRRAGVARARTPGVDGGAGGGAGDDLGDGLDDGVGDDELAMLFMCCHPALSRPARVALSLKTVGGFSVEEIAAAFLTAPATIAQRLVRAKRRLRELGVALAVPPPRELRSRLDALLEVLYLLFTEGYTAHAGENLVRADLCGEAIRLAGLLARNPATNLPAVHALLALMLLQASRMPARTGAGGDLLLLSEQDHGSWDQGMIAAGLRHLERASAGRELTPYHLEAGIAACHAVAPDAAGTDWPAILAYYDDLLALKPTPVVALNRAIALARVRGPAVGLRALDALRHEPTLRRYYLLPAALGALSLEAGDRHAAARYYREALTLPCSEPERRFLARQLAACAGSRPTATPRRPRRSGRPGP